MDVVVISQSERLPSGALSLSLFLSPTRLELVLCRFLKIRNHEPRFLLLFSERRNCESKNDSFLIHFTILLAKDSGINPRKKAKKQSRNQNCNSFGIRFDTALIDDDGGGAVQFVAQAELIFAHLYAFYNNVAAKADKMEK